MEATSKCMKSYTEIINKHPLLTREEELDLVNTMNRFKTGDKRKEARDKLFNSNLRLVIQQSQILKKLANLPIEDLIGSGIEGLGMAIDRFNPEKFNTKLSTFAMFWIRLKLYQSITSFNHMVYVPRHIINKSKHLRNITDDSIIKMTDKEIMENLDISEVVLKNIQAAKSSHMVSLDSECNKDGEDSSTLKDIIADKKAKTADNICSERDRSRRVREFLNKLDPIAKDILCCRYMGDTKENLSDVGKKYNITGERVRQIEKLALKKLKQRMKDRSLFSA